MTINFFKVKEEVENLQQLTPNIKVAQFYSDFQQFQARLPECQVYFLHFGV